MRTLLVDADIFAYKATAATEKVYLFGGAGSDPVVDPNLNQALDIAARDIEAVANKLKATKVIVCLTDDVKADGTIDNFRCDFYPQYKMHRKDVRRPSTLRAVKDFYASNFETYQRPRLEADDCMGILSTHATLVPGERVIVSGDKDMKTIPGLLFNPRHVRRRVPTKISGVAADRFFMQQTLTGDAVDGYPGCPGIGDKSPYVVELAHCRTLAAMWEVVVAGYASKGRTPADALVQARCARILRACDWDFVARKPRLWSPPVNYPNQ